MLAAKVLKLLEKMSTRNKRTVGSLYRVSSIRDIDFNLGCLMLEGGTENLGALGSLHFFGRQGPGKVCMLSCSILTRSPLGQHLLPSFY